MSDPVPIGPVGLGVATALVIVAAGLARAVRLRLTADFAWGVVRTVAQLLLVGVVLLAIFEAQTPALVLAAFLVMLAVATVTAARRLGRPPPGALGAIGLGLAVASAGTTIAVTVLVVRAEPWWAPRYLIPLAGMITASAMNAAALAAERLASEIRGRREEVEQLLALGATPRQAVDGPLRSALRAALIPAINAMLTVGIVQLPGMMTGQIIAGADPTLAARYQIVVMFMLAFANTVAAIIVGTLLARRFFTPAWQLRPELLAAIDDD